MAARRLPTFLRQNEADALLSLAAADVQAATTAKKRLRAKRDLAIVTCFLFSGLRVSELCKLTIPQLDFDRRTIFVLAGKGDKDRYVPIPEKLLPVLIDWAGGRKEGPLFPSPSGRCLSSRTLQARIPVLAVRAGISKRIKPHSLRHSYATKLLETGASIREVQELLGHSSVATTEKYTHVLPERLRGAVDRL